MNWKEFFKLTKVKIIITVILVVIYLLYLWQSFFFTLDTVTIGIPLVFYEWCSICIPETKSFNILFLIIDLVIAFTISYLVSCLIIFIYNRIKR